MTGVWSLETIYLALGFPGVKTLPRTLSMSITYAGLPLTVESSASKRNCLYRVYVTCMCGKQVPYCKMPQHKRAKRHDNDRHLFARTTPESEALHLKYGWSYDNNGTR